MWAKIQAETSFEETYRSLHREKYWQWWQKIQVHTVQQIFQNETSSERAGKIESLWQKFRWQKHDLPIFPFWCRRFCWIPSILCRKMPWFVETTLFFFSFGSSFLFSQLTPFLRFFLQSLVARSEVVFLNVTNLGHLESLTLLLLNFLKVLSIFYHLQKLNVYIYSCNKITNTWIQISRFYSNSL